MNPELSIKSVIHPGDRIYTGEYTQKKSTQKSTQKQTKQQVWQSKKPYERAETPEEHNYRMKTSQEYKSNYLADVPRAPVQHKAADYLGQFRHRARYYPNPTVAGNGYWMDSNFTKFVNKHIR